MLIENEWVMVECLVKLDVTLISPTEFGDVIDLETGLEYEHGLTTSQWDLIKSEMNREGLTRKVVEVKTNILMSACMEYCDSLPTLIEEDVFMKDGSVVKRKVERSELERVQLELLDKLKKEYEDDGT